jgi:hypothetical protein
MDGPSRSPDTKLTLCRIILKTSNQGGALRAPWADPCAGLRPWGPRPARAGPHAIVPLIMAGHPAGHPVLDIAVFLGASSVPLPATASRSLPAVASHAIGYAEPRPAPRSPGFRRLSRMTEGTRTRPRACAVMPRRRTDRPT